MKCYGRRVLCHMWVVRCAICCLLSLFDVCCVAEISCDGCLQRVVIIVCCVLRCVYVCVFYTFDCVLIDVCLCCDSRDAFCAVGNAV